MNRQKRSVSIEQLPAAIEDLLKPGPHSINEIARALGWSYAAVRARVEQLAHEQRVHRRRVRADNCTGVCYSWHHGPSPDAASAPRNILAIEPLRAELQAIVPFQYSVRVYPAIDRRDPLVAALFGPARAHRTVTP